jgi:periplasmic copper chaperone A
MKNPKTLVLAGAVFLSLAARADIVAVEGWTRATVPGATSAAGYLILSNTSDGERKLLRLTSTVTDEVSLHRSAVDANGVSKMWPVGALELRPGEQLRFEPNGMHVMFRNLNRPLVAGATVPLTFQFDKGEAPVTVLLQVKPLVPDAAATPAAPMDHSHH